MLSFLDLHCFYSEVDSIICILLWCPASVYSLALLAHFKIDLKSSFKCFIQKHSKCSKQPRFTEITNGQSC